MQPVVGLGNTRFSINDVPNLNLPSLTAHVRSLLFNFQFLLNYSGKAAATTSKLQWEKLALS